MSHIAISGRAGAGKTTLGGILERDHGYVRISFADALKEEVFELYGLTKTDPGGRDKLVEHGDGRRAEQADYWVVRYAERFRWARLCGLKVVCDDLRFDVEYDFCRAQGFTLCKVTAPVSVRREHLARQGTDPNYVGSLDPGEITMENPALDWDYLARNDPREGNSLAWYAFQLCVRAEAAPFVLDLAS